MAGSMVLIVCGIVSALAFFGLMIQAHANREDKAKRTKFSLLMLAALVTLVIVLAISNPVSG